MRSCPTPTPLPTGKWRRRFVESRLDGLTDSPRSGRSKANTSAELDLHLICDNYGTHKTPAINRWLAAHPRFHLHFTPTSSSWLNLVERWFAELTNRKLRRSAHHSIAELDADVIAWIHAWNDNSKPSVWTKTADQILDSLAHYCHKLTALNSDSAH